VCTSLKIKAWRFLRDELCVVAVLLLCLGFSLTLLSLPARGSQDPSALGMANVLTVDQGANVNAPPLDGTYYPFALAEEADEDPVNAGLLTMLLLASFFGASVAWLLTNAQGQGALCFSSVGVVGGVLGSAREEYFLPFLGMFRL
jgi:hypothetical protein